MVIAKIKGSNAERQLIHMFWNNNIAAARVAGSGSIQLPMPDIIAGKSKNIVVIECKNTKNRNVYLKQQEIYELEQFALMMGAMPLVAVKVNNKGWFFLHTNSIKKTEALYSFNLNDEEMAAKMMSFDKIVSFLNQQQSV